MNKDKYLFFIGKIKREKNKTLFVYSEMDGRRRVLDTRLDSLSRLLALSLHFPVEAL